MFTTMTVKLTTPTLLQLIQYLQSQGGTRDLGEAIQTAVDDWLRARGQAPAMPTMPATPVTPTTPATSLTPVARADRSADPDDGQDNSCRDSCCDDHAAAQVDDLGGAGQDARGYQWKTLFLPEGTVLRSWSYGEHNYARVQGDRIMHRGCPLTPNQFARQFARTTRNAWKDLYIRRPGDAGYTLAIRLRDMQTMLAMQATPATQPPQTMQAPKTMLAQSRHTRHTTPVLQAAQESSPAQQGQAPSAIAALIAAAIGAVTASLTPPDSDPEAAPRDATPGEGWTLPERRSKRFRLEDVAFS